jgi:hypothetical protein
MEPEVNMEKLMNRRNLFLGIAASAVTAVPAKSSNAGTKRSATYTVPAGIKHIRVRSWKKDGTEVLDTHFTVQPGQFFRIDAV